MLSGASAGYFLRKNQEKAGQQSLLRKSREDAQQAQRAAKTTAIRLDRDSTKIISTMQKERTALAEVISELNTQFNSNQEPTDNFKGLISTIQDKFTNLFNATETMAQKFNQLYEKFRALTMELAETRKKLAEKNQEMKDTVNTIKDRAAFINYHTIEAFNELETKVLSIPHPDKWQTLQADLNRYKKQNELYKKQVKDLQAQNERQSEIILNYSPKSVEFNHSKRSPPQDGIFPTNNQNRMFDQTRTPAALPQQPTLSSSLPATTSNNIPGGNFSNK